MPTPTAVVAAAWEEIRPVVMPVVEIAAVAEEATAQGEEAANDDVRTQRRALLG
jgi:hypothetical protein